MQNQNHNKILILAIIILALGNIFFAYKYIAKTRTLDEATQKQRINDKVLSFTQLFMDKALRGGTAVSFDDRLQLENSVRALNDKEIYTSWEKFTSAKSQTEVQQNFYALFELLLGKIAI